MNFAEATSFRIAQAKATASSVSIAACRLWVENNDRSAVHLCGIDEVPRCNCDVPLRHSSEFDSSRKLSLTRIVSLGRRNAEARIAY